MVRFGHWGLVCLLGLGWLCPATAAPPSRPAPRRAKTTVVPVKTAPLPANTAISSDQFGLIMATPMATVFRYPTVVESPSPGSIVATPTIYTASLGASLEGVSGGASIRSTPDVYAIRLADDGTGQGGLATIRSTPDVYAIRLADDSTGQGGQAAVLSRPVVYAQRLEGVADGTSGNATIIATPPVYVQSALADFERSLDPFTIYDRASKATWGVESHAGQTGAFIYNLGSDAAADDWLIGPPVLLSTDGGGLLNFDYYNEFTDSLAAPLQVLVSTNYQGGDPTAATWTDLTPAALASSATGAWAQIANASLAPFSGATVRVAFRYRSSGTAIGQCKRIGIDNVYIFQNLYLPPAITGFTADGTEITDGTVFHKDVLLGVTAQNLSRVGKAQFLYRPTGSSVYTIIGEDDNPADGLTCLWPLSQSPDGAYELSVQLFNGGKSTSRVNQVSVALRAPGAPQITAPVSPATTAAATGQITIQSDPDITLKVYLNGSLAQTLRPTDLSTTVDLDLLDGVNTIYATAENRAGASASSNVLQLTRARPQPVIHLTLDNNFLMEGDTLSGFVGIDKALTSALSITLSTTQASRINAGPLVTIPAGQTQAAFTITGLENHLIEPTLQATLTASSPGAVSASTLILIGDDDRPSLQLLLDHTVVMENAGPNALTGRLVRQPASDTALTVQIISSRAELTPPVTVTIPASTTAVTFPVGVVDNTVADGPRTVTLQAQLSASGELLASSNVAAVQIADDEGPTLTLQTAKPYLLKGANANITVQRSGAALTGALTVNISTGDAAHLRATKPTITFPAGAASAMFTVEAPANAVTEGTLPESIVVSATGFSPAELVLKVTDTPLPDLIVQMPDAPAQTGAGVNFDMQFEIANVGAADTAGEFTQKVFLSRDQTLDETSDLLVSQTSYADTLVAGTAFNDLVNVRAPLETGKYWIIVETDALHAIDEMDETNNVFVFPQPLEVVVPYTAQISADSPTYPVNAAVSLHGSATKANGRSAANVAVDVHIMHGATDRVLHTTADAQGSLALTWQPLAGESGDYTVGAVYPGYATAPVQGAFTILNFDASFPTDVAQFTEGGNTTVQGTLHNSSGFALTGLSATVLNAPAGLQFSITLPGKVLGAGQTFNVFIQATAATGFTGSATVTVRVTSAEGVVIDVPVRVYVRPAAAQLTINPSALETSVVRGQQKTVTLALQNIGSAPTDSLTVALSPVSWIKLASPSSVPAIAPGSAATISVLLTPPSTQALTTYQGSIVVYSAQRTWAQTTFNFRVVSNAQGDFEAEIVDEYTFFAAGAPKVAGATVTLRDPLTSQVVSTLHTGTDGKVDFSNMLEGWYTVDVSAPDHTRSTGNYYFTAGQTNYRRLFITRNTVQYTWIVQPVDIEDRYTITVKSTFETNVPVPVVTVTPPQIDVSDLNVIGQTKVVNLVVENHGLINAENGKFDFGTHPLYTFEPLITDVGTIAAKSSVTVPVVVRCVGQIGPNGTVITQGVHGNRPAAAKGQPLAAAVQSVPCSVTAGFTWGYLCGGLHIGKATPIAISGVLGTCPPNTPPLVYTPPPDLTQPPKKDPSDPTDPAEPVDPQRDGPTIIVDGPEVTGPYGLPYIPPITSINFSPPTTCDCEASAKLSLSKEFDLKSLAGMLAAKLTAACPIQLEDFKVDFSLDAEVSLCCDGPGLLQGSGTASGNVTITAVAGKDISGAVKFPQIVGNFKDLSCSIKAFVGAKVTFMGSLTVDAKRDCDGNWHRCVHGQVDLIGKVGGAIDVDASAKGPGQAAASGSLKGELALDGTAEAWISDCLEDQGEGGKGYQAGACAKLSGTAEISGSLSYKNEAGVSVSTDVSVGGTVDLAKTGRCAGEPATEATHAKTNKRVLAAKPGKGVRSGDVADDLSEIIPESSFVLSTQQVYDILHPAPANGVCAHVKIELDQQAVVTRSAFKATLELDNSSPTTTLTGVGFTLDVRDANGNAVTDLFGVPAPDTTGLDNISGSGTLAPGASGVVTWTLIPTDAAAPQQDTPYVVGGTINYIENGTQVSIPVVPAAITVKPDAALYLTYFHERDVLGDDPDTPVIEPSVPYTLALIVENRGAGTARNLRITSAQPQIVDNEKGLLIDFKVIGTQIDGNTASPSLTASLGDIAPGRRENVSWLFTSSLQGLFIDYQATFEHIDGLGDPRLSLIKNVEIHESIHTVKSLAPGADDLPDYLVNDVADFNDYPDTIYFSEGGTAPVRVLQTDTTTGSLTGNNPVVTLQAPLGTGWTYLLVSDPANGAYQLTRVVRSDGLELPIGTDVWTTDRTFVGRNQPAVRENMLHLLDFNSTNQYTLYYQALQPKDTTAPSSRVAALPASSASLIPLQWSGSDDRAVAFYDIYASVDGGAWQLWLVKTPSTSAVYPGQLGHRYAFYSRATDTSGNTEAAKTAAEAQTQVTLTNSLPILGAVADQTVVAGSVFEYQLSASDPDGPASALRYSLSSDQPGVVVDPIKGLVRWVTGKGDGGTKAIVTVTVTDGSVPAGTAQRQFHLTVVAVNTPPVLAPLASQFCDVGSILTLVAQATDNDLPPQSITYSLGLGAPVGMTIDPASGIIRWSPTLDDARKIYLIEVNATDNGTPALSSKQVFTVTVGGNHVPIAVTDYLSTDQNRAVIIRAKKLLRNDSDADGDPLTLTLVSTTSIQGGSVGLFNNLVTYVPPTDFTGADAFTYWISDNNGGVAAGTVAVTVRAAGATAPSNPVTVTPLPNGSIQLDMVGIPGRTYVVQASDDLVAWRNLVSLTVNQNGTLRFTDTDAPNHPKRFYRLALP